MNVVQDQRSNSAVVRVAIGINLAPIETPSPSRIPNLQQATSLRSLMVTSASLVASLCLNASWQKSSFAWKSAQVDCLKDAQVGSVQQLATFGVPSLSSKSEICVFPVGHLKMAPAAVRRLHDGVNSMQHVASYAGSSLLILLNVLPLGHTKGLGSKILPELNLQVGEKFLQQTSAVTVGFCKFARSNVFPAGQSYK